MPNSKKWIVLDARLAPADDSGIREVLIEIGDEIHLLSDGLAEKLDKMEGLLESIKELLKEQK